MTLATFVEALGSNKRVVLLAPAILLLGAAVAIGRSEPEGVPVLKAEQAAVTAPKFEEAQPAPEKVAPAAQKVAAADTSIGPAQRKQIEAIIKEYLTKNPEILVEMQNALQSKEDEIMAARMAAVIKSNATEIFRPAFSPVVGNAKGDVPVLEFFDYNCGYCKRAFGDVARLMEKDKQVRVILKELPILSKGSEEAAKVALAAKMQGKYWEFHRAMLESTGQANEASALRVAEKVNLDMAKLRKDMASAEVKKELEDTRALAQKLGIQGTPHFMISDRIIPGAPENLLERMTKFVADVRQEGCKIC